MKPNTFNYNSFTDLEQDLILAKAEIEQLKARLQEKGPCEYCDGAEELLVEIAAFYKKPNKPRYYHPGIHPNFCPICGRPLKEAADKYHAERNDLQKALSASRRRERAAVELIGKVSQAVEVAFNATDYVKPNTGIWHTLGLALDWIKAWRGPQEAGKGETK